MNSFCVIKRKKLNESAFFYFGTLYQKKKWVRLSIKPTQLNWSLVAKEPAY